MQQFNKKIICTAIFYGVLSTSAFASDYFVDGSSLGDNSNTGNNISAPFKTLDHALSLVSDGDVIHIRKGIYKISVKRNDIKGVSTSPIIIQAYVDGSGNIEEVTFDGRDTLPNSWVETFSGSHLWEQVLPASTTSTPTPWIDQAATWQLFRNGELLVNARWPNANFSDGTMYGRAAWALAEDVRPNLITTANDTASRNGVSYDLSTVSANLTGALIIANSRNFMTYTRKITGQSGNTLTHASLAFATDGHNYYYLEGHKDLLDTENEWFIEPTTNTVSLWTTTDPNLSLITGRTQKFAIDGKKWEHVEFKNLNFVATSLDLKESESITLTNCNFKYSAVGKRALGEATSKASVVRLKNETSGGGNFKVINSTFSHSEAQALYIKGSNTQVENSLFEYVDWTSTETYMPSASIVFNGVNTIFKNNTVHHAGTSEAIATEGDIRASYNHIYNTGYAQSDGAMLQIRVPSQNGSIIHHNWLHDSEKYGFRFDAPVPAEVWGENGYSHHNVVWNTGGIMGKSVDGRHFANVAMGNSNIDMIVLDEFSVPTSGAPVKSNASTRTINNVADTLSGHRKNEIAIPGIDLGNYSPSASVKGLFSDADNYDFRPVSTSLIDQGEKITDTDYSHPNVNNLPDIGAYESGNTYYWIPGRKEKLASHPIPLNGNTALKGSALMWREALNGTKYEVYTGTSASALSYKDVFLVNENVYQPSANLAVGKHYWRVDTTVNGLVETGPVWEFTVITPPVIHDLLNDDMEDGNVSDWTVSNVVKVISAAANSSSFGSRIKATSFMEKGIDTTGYTNITLSYDRRTRNFDTGESLKVEWFDGTVWSVLEDTTDTNWATSNFILPSAANSNASVKVRFSTFAGDNIENADVDNVLIQGTVITATTLFSDDLEAGLLWTKGGSDKKISVISAAANTGSFGVRVKQDSFITKVIDTTGYNTITVSYARRTVGFDSGESLVVKWSVDGNNWIELEQVGGDISYATQSFTLDPTAGNSSVFELRFETNNDLTSERAEIDNILVTGL